MGRGRKQGCRGRTPLRQKCQKAKSVGWCRSRTTREPAMFSRIGAIIRKEFIQIRRDRRTLAIVLVLPVMQLLLLGYGINTVVDHLPTIVLDESRDAASRALVSALQNSGYSAVVGYVHTRQDVV